MKIPLSSLFLLIILLCSCEKQKLRNIKPVVDRDLVTFESNQIPSALTDIINEYRIIILGETHYVQEHQEYISLVLEHSIYDSLIFITESFNAFNWMIEDYVNLESDYLPDCVNFFDNYWINRVRDINKTGRHVLIKFMDVNHWRDNFITSVLEIEKRIGPVDEFQSVKGMQADTYGYRAELQHISEVLELNTDILTAKYGKWYKIFCQLVESEIMSSDYRINPADQRREAFMTDFILGITRKYPSKKVIINCGMYHAQKETRMGRDINRIAHFVEEENPEQTCTIAFVGIKGNWRRTFYDPPFLFNLLEETDKHDLINIIGNAAGVKCSLIILSDDIFEEEMLVTYGHGNTVVLEPSVQFDAIITYPEISILKSMTDFDYE